MESSEVILVDDSKDPNKRGSKARRTSKQSQFKVSDVVSTLFEDFLSNSGITILSASSGEDVAYENKSIGNGAFTSAYINILKSEFIKHLIDLAHITAIYQGRGEEPYKKYWTPNGELRKRKGLTVFNTNLKGMFLAFLMSRVLPIIEKSWSAMGKFPDRLPSRGCDSWSL